MGEEHRPLILVGVDGTETSLRAGAFTAGLAVRQRAHVICLYVHTLAALAATQPGAAGAMAETQRDVATEIRSAIEDNAVRLGISIEFVERQGNPFRELTRLAAERRVDQVVVGASTQAGHRLVGSLAVHLVREAKWPVTVVP